MTTDFELESDESTTSGCCHSAAEQSSTISHFRIRGPVTVTAQTACSMERAYMYPPRRETAAFWREFLGVDQVVPSSKPIGRLPERLLKMNGYSGGGLRALLDDPNFVSSLSERNGIITGSDHKQDSVKYKLSEPTYDASAALLAGGPTDIWSGIGFGTEGGDFLECMDLDEFLMESGLASLEVLPPADQRSASQSPNQESSEPARSPQFLEDYPTEAPVNENSLSIPTTPSIPASPQEPEVQADDSDIEVGPARPPINMIKKRRFEKDGEGLDEASVIVVPGQDGFDPVTARFKPEELQPQPIIKKSRKILVPEASKDDKYWRRRNKNNVAAKRSREARRAKENQIIMRASFLEEENERLTAENQQLLMENERFQELLKKSGLVA